MDFHNLKLEQVARLEKFFGLEVIIKMAEQLPDVGVKYGDETMGTFELLLNQLCQLDPKVLGAIKRGERKLTTEEVIRLLFDHTSRAIPAHLNITKNVKDENGEFHVELPKINTDDVYDQLVDIFPLGTEFVSKKEFPNMAADLRGKYANNELLGNFFRRARPIILPKHDARKNYGASMQDFILPAVERAYKKHFPERKFVNYRNGELAGKVSIIPGTGHDELVSLMAEKSIVVWYSPNPFQGFSVNAQREAMKVLMQYGGFALAGGVDAGTAAIAYIGAIARDYKTPVYTCSALSWQSADYSLYFSANGDEFCFDFTDYLADAHANYSGGLVLFR